MNLDINIRKKLYGAIVPLTCGSEHATAFFVTENILLTARHAVIDNLYNGTPVFISPSKTYVCEVDEIGEVDVVLLRCGEYSSSDSLNLLSARFNEDIRLMVMGFPAELGNNRDIISLDIRNRIESHTQECDVLVVREDNLALTNYKGFSGSPVLNDSGSVIGVMTNRISQTLGYVSIRRIDEMLRNKGFDPSKNDLLEDNTTYGRGRSIQQIHEAINLAGNRYSPDLHVVDAKLDNDFRCFVNQKDAEKASSEIKKMKDWLTSADRSFRDEAREIMASERNHKMADLFTLAFRSKNNNERYFYSNNKVLYNQNIRIADLFGKKCIVLNGKAGSGKTHLLCYQSLALVDIANVYLTFGSQFNAEESIMTQLSRILKFEDDNLLALNNKMVATGSYAIIIIDALNEGASDKFWEENLNMLLKYVLGHSNIKLILSARDQSDTDIFEKIKEHPKTIEIILSGFADVNSAITKYFDFFNIKDDDGKIRERYFSDFKNPLFLKIFCRVAREIGVRRILNQPRSVLYWYYVWVRNVDVCRQVDEDEHRHITNDYLMDLAKYSVNYDHCLPVPREKARTYADRICRNRLWSKSLLNVCLKENLLLPVYLNSRDSQRLMFEYEQLGDFLKVAAMNISKRSKEQVCEYLMDESKRHSSSHLDHFIVALLSEWQPLKEMLDKPSFVNNFKERLLESVKLQNVNTEMVKAWAEMHGLYEVNLLLGHIANMSIDDMEKFNNYMLSQSLYDRDKTWTVNIGSLYSEYAEEMFQETISFEDKSPNGDKKTCVFLLWMCTCPHPQVRAIILRRLVTIFLQSKDEDLLEYLIKQLHTCNDPYVLHILYASIYGWALLSRNVPRIGVLSKLVFELHYENHECVPLDIVIRHWTQSLLAFSVELGNEDVLSRSLPPYPTQNPYELIRDMEFDNNYFGSSNASRLLYESINGFADFNRYTIGTNNSNESHIYILENKGKYEWVSLYDMIKMINNIVKHDIGWKDEIGELFNDKYSSNRSHNKTERIGKKYQMLALYKVEALLSDHCRMTDGFSWYYREIPTEDCLPNIPFAWYSDKIPAIDPTLSDEIVPGIELTPVIVEVKDKKMTDAEWENDDSIMPKVRFELKDKDQNVWMILTAYDTKKITPEEMTRDLFLFVNSGFVKKTELKKLTKWGKSTNFYGRWMPESRGMCDFLWGEYAWSERYKRYLKEDQDYHPHNCPVKTVLTYVGQLQEDTEGILNADDIESTVYAPNLDMMDFLGLYTAERGVVRLKENKEVAATNFRIEGFNGIAVRKDLLDKYLEDRGLVLAYYLCGEKYWHDEHYRNIGRRFDLSGCYIYMDGENRCIQPINVVQSYEPRNDNP